MITALLFALAGLVMGLIRPEGVLLATLMLFAVIYEGLQTIAWDYSDVFCDVYAY